MNQNCLFTHGVRCVKRQTGFITWETGPPPRGRCITHAPLLLMVVSKTERMRPDRGVVG